MQGLFQSLKSLLLMSLSVLFLAVGTIISFPLPVSAVENNADKNTTCKGWIITGYDNKGNGGIVINNNDKGSKEQDFTRINLSGKNLTEVNLSGANLSQGKLSGANLSGADLSGATLIRVNLKGVTISDVDWSGVKFSKQELLSLIKVNVTGSGWLSSATLSKQDILDLLDSDIHQLALTGDNLTEANLSGANLSKANLTGANLQGAKLGGVNLTGADLTGAKMPNGKIYKP